MHSIIKQNPITNQLIISNEQIMAKLDVKQLRSMVLQYFQCLSSGENYVQCMKQALFIDDKFNPLLIFDMVSLGKQVQTKRDWKNYLHQINVEFSQDEIRYFFNHHKFGEQVRFHEFIEAFMPFNADVLRVFKKNYIELVELQKRDPEVEQIFAELIKFEIQFCRKLIKIKKQITQVASSQNIINLVKQDLVFENHKRGLIRESVKYKQKFQSPDYQLGYDELRRFLELWLNPKQINFQFELLQIKRHLGTQGPFKYIILKSESNFSPLKKRSYSAAKLSNKKPAASSTNVKQRESKDKYSSSNRYDDFKTDLMQGLIKNYEGGLNNEENKFEGIHIREGPQNYGSRAQTAMPSGVRGSFQKQDRSGAKEKQGLNSREEYLRNLRFARDKTCINGIYIVNILEEISRKEERVERLRKKLANCFQFNLINLFKLVDHNNKGFASAKNIQQYLNSPSEKQYVLLVEYYGREKDKLRFQDFCMIFRPLSKKLNEALDEKPENVLPNPFKRQTLSLIAQILTLSAEMFNNIQSTKLQINNDGININNLFKYVDVKNKGYIEAEDIQDLLEEKRIECDQRILKGVMKIFKKRLTDKIQYQEFQAFVDM